MEYVYSAMLLHSAGKEITEKAVTDIVKAAGVDVDSSRVKALISALKDINIEEAIKKAAVVQAAAPTAAPAAGGADSAKAEKKEEEKKTEEEAAQGLSSLFG
ncbi:MAG: 50S ribosomal protein P1 [Candidatus Diapherotrites archaeon]